MSDSTFEIFSKFVTAFKGLTDADEAVTLASITPILGDQVNASTLIVVSKFLTNFFHEEIDGSYDSYVCLKGIRLPISAFSSLRYLVATTPPGVLTTLANALATIGADDVFPESFVSSKVLSDVEFWDMNNAQTYLVDRAKEKLYKDFTSGKTVEDLVVEHKLSTSSDSEVGRASS